jgi:hypothetical protein
MKPDRELGFLSFMAAVVPSVFISVIALAASLDWIVSTLARQHPLLARIAIVTDGILCLVLAFVLLELFGRIFRLFRWSRH